MYVSFGPRLQFGLALKAFDLPPIVEAGGTRGSQTLVSGVDVAHEWTAMFIREGLSGVRWRSTGRFFTEDSLEGRVDNVYHELIDIDKGVTEEEKQTKIIIWRKVASLSKFTVLIRPIRVRPSQRAKRAGRRTGQGYFAGVP